MSRIIFTIIAKFYFLDFLTLLYYDFRMTEKKTTWLSRRLKEIGKTKIELAERLKCHSARFSELENGAWNFQIDQIKPAAEFLNFETSAFLDFISGNITEQQLWEAKPPVKISDEDMRLLAAVKSLAIRKEETYTSENTSEQTKIPSKEQER